MKFVRFYKKTLILEEAVEIACFILLFLTVLIQIFFRLKPIAMNIDYAPVWTEELSRWLYVYIVFFGSSLCIHNGEHIGIDIFVEKLPYKLKKIVLSLVDIIMMACCVVFIIYGLKNMVFAARQYPMTLPFSNAYLYVVVPIGFFLMLIRLLFIFIMKFLPESKTSEGNE